MQIFKIRWHRFLWDLHPLTCSFRQPLNFFTCLSPVDFMTVIVDRLVHEVLTWFQLLLDAGYAINHASLAPVSRTDVHLAPMDMFCTECDVQKFALNGISLISTRKSVGRKLCCCVYFKHLHSLDKSYFSWWVKYENQPSNENIVPRKFAT